MRDFVVLAALLAFLPLALVRLHIATLLWTWIAVMAPHRLAYGFVFTAPINKIIAVISVIAVFISPDKKRLPGGTLMVLIILFFLWTTLTTFVGSTYPVSSHSDYFTHIFPIFVHFILIMICINSKDRLHAFIWIIVASLGWHGTKMGLVTIVEGGSPASSVAYGPLGTLIQDRNHFALAMVMLLPILFYLYIVSKSKIMRLLILGVGTLSLISVLGSFSRGGFVALLAMSGVLWWRSKNKLLIAFVMFIGAGVAVMLVPAEFKERMSTIREQFTKQESRFVEKELDLSFAQRLSVWRMGGEMIKDSPITGHGVRAIQQAETAVRFAVPDDPLYGSKWYLARAAHNIYIQVATDSGLVGLALFLALFIVAFFNCQWIMRNTRDVAELQVYYHLARFIPVSLVGYMVGGAALSMAYYDGFYMILLTIVCVRRLVLEAQGKAKPRYIPALKEQRLKERLRKQSHFEEGRTHAQKRSKR